MRRIMSKEDFLAILARQQQSGLTIKDFCENEASCLFLTPILTLCVAILLEAEYSLFL
jgi:putative transposase